MSYVATAPESPVLPKMLSGANAFEISDFREDETENVLTQAIGDVTFLHLGENAE